MLQIERVLALLELVKGQDLTFSKIGDICNIKTPELEPIMIRLVRSETVLESKASGFANRQKLYRLAPK